jgi:AcrR family transcriptional regulator
MKRLTRAEQNERNRSLVLAAARRTFLARGYHSASLDEIADEAGFSRGVVQSRFGNKADLFLALLEERITERAALNARVAGQLSGDDGLAALAAHATRRNEAELDWGLLLIEFRAHAARDPVLSQRYAAAHARSLEGIADVITALYQRAGRPPPQPPRQMAQLILIITAGSRLEQAAGLEDSPQLAAAQLLASFTAPPAPPGDGRTS